MTDAAPDVPVRDAATVVLLRDGGPDGPEVWMLTRVTDMAFAAGMSVFPGGRVDDVPGGDADLPLVGGDVEDFAARSGADVRTARALLGAAVRETFEETGVLLTVPAAELPDAVADVEAGRVRFGDLLREHGLAVDAGALRPWSRWITPPGEVRRYDTRFFVGALPPGSVARDLTTESSRAEWVAVRTAIEQGRRGERRLLPPTQVTLETVAGHASVADVLAAAAGRSLDPVEPEFSVADDGSVTVTLPEGRSFLLRGPT